jgi:hypothetical protein
MEETVTDIQTKDRQIESELYKMRGVGKCVQAATDLFIGNLKLIVRHTWKAALTIGLLTALLVVVSMSGGTSSILNGDAANSLWPCLLLVPLLMAEAWLMGCVTTLLNNQPRKPNLRRAFRQMALWVGISIVVMAASAGISMLWIYSLHLKDGMTGLLLFFGSAGLVYLLFLLALLPMLYSSMKYLIDPTQRLGIVLGKSYREGWRYWGFLFVLALLTLLFAAIIYALLMIPMQIVFSAQIYSAVGVQMGDPSGLPSYMPVLMAFTTCLCVTAWVYVCIWVFLIFYYAYGSIEAKLAARKNLQMTKQA